MPEETVIFKKVEALASPTTSHGIDGNKHSEVSGKKSDVMNTYVLKHVKNDFYKKDPDQLAVAVYVKQIDKESLQVIFGVKTLCLKFKTRCKDFLKLHDQVSEETIFEWNITLRHEVDDKNCKYALRPTKLTMTLKRACVKDQWNSLEDLNVKGAVYGTLKNGQGHLHSTPQSEIAKMNGIKTDGTRKIGKNGDVSFKHCNGTNVSNETETPRSIESSLGLETKGVPRSLADDEQGAVKQTVNCTNSKNYKVKGLDDHSEDVFCSDKISDNKITSNHETNTEITNGASKQQNIDRKDSSDSTKSKDICSKTVKKTDTKESSCVKVTKTNEVVTSDDSGEETNTLEEAKNFELSYDAKKHICVPGSAGLANPANLCYINSVVQCLSSVIELRTYLLAKKHSGHVNRENKNGYRGELINIFESVLRELWSGKERVVSASRLKYLLGKKHKQFMHYGQGDAQEFLTFLVDGLHEDLKDEKKKTLTEIKGDASRDIAENSRMHWNKYINGNKSVVSDLFQGQSVSEVLCQDCTKPSTSFDHWMQLNLPIPEDPKYLSVYVFFLDPEKKPLETKLKVYQGTRCSEVTAKLSDIVHIPAGCLLLLRSQYNRISHIYDPLEEVSLSSDKEILIACEILCPKQDVSSGSAKEKSVIDEKIDNPSTLHIAVIQRMTHKVNEKCKNCGLEKRGLLYCSKCCTVAYCNRECQRSDWKRHRQYCNFQPSIIGTPFVVSIDASEATLNNIKAKAFYYARYSVAPRKGDIESSKFHLTLLENLTDYQSKGQELKDKGGTPVVDENVCLAWDWDATTADRKVISKDLECNIHDSAKEDHSSEVNSCSLEDCLKLFWNPEDINKECGWRCDHCKDVRAATRKVTICRHPEYLVIHLKRFSYSGNGRKIYKHVQFPLRGLDMSSFTHAEISREQATYDLRGVCSHYGYMNFGHYIALCKPYSEEELDKLTLTSTDGWLKYDDNKVSSAEEGDVENTQAYILFYRRRESNTNTNCVLKQTSEINCNGTKEESRKDSRDRQSIHEIVETSDGESKQDYNTANNMKNADFLANELEETLPHSLGCCSVNGKVLLEDILD